MNLLLLHILESSGKILMSKKLQFTALTFGGTFCGTSLDSKADAKLDRVVFVEQQRGFIKVFVIKLGKTTFKAVTQM